MTDFHHEFLQPGDPLFLNGVFACVTSLGSGGFVTVQALERQGMPGPTWSMEERLAYALRDSFPAHLRALGAAPVLD